MDESFDTKQKMKGPKDFIVRNEITKITREMIAYAALQVFSTP